MNHPITGEAFLMKALMRQAEQDARERELAKRIRAQRVAAGYQPPLRRAIDALRRRRPRAVVGTPRTAQP